MLKILLNVNLKKMSLTRVIIESDDQKIVTAIIEKFKTEREKTLEFFGLDSDLEIHSLEGVMPTKLFISESDDSIIEQ